MFSSKYLKILIFLLILPFFLNSCANRGDARKSPPDPKLRVKRNIEEGRGFRLMDNVKGGGATNYQFATSNELWRASIDVLDFVPFTNASYSGGILITEWFDGNPSENSNRDLKITVRFLTNEIRSDALEISIHEKICKDNSLDCSVSKIESKLQNDIKIAILKRAAILEKKGTAKIVEEFKKSGKRIVTNSDEN